MKLLFTATTVLLFFALTSCETKKEPTKERDPIVQMVVENITNIMNIESDAPILDWKLLAIEQADKVLKFDLDNIDDVFDTAKKGEYKKVFLTTGDHTLVEVLDMNDCERSRTWMTCMPKGRGYIKRIEMTYKEDMVNNMIGTPDRQERMAFYFY